MWCGTEFAASGTRRRRRRRRRRRKRVAPDRRLLCCREKGARGGACFVHFRISSASSGTKATNQPQQLLLLLLLLTNLIRLVRLMCVSLYVCVCVFVLVYHNNWLKNPIHHQENQSPSSTYTLPRSLAKGNKKHVSWVSNCVILFVFFILFLSHSLSVSSSVCLHQIQCLCVCLIICVSPTKTPCEVLRSCGLCAICM